ncbi:MAG: protein-glutamate O-methyltransferase CheR [Pseudomonadota bacterium]
MVWNKFNRDTAFALSDQLDSIGVGAYIVSDNTFLHVNRSLCSILGIDFPDAIVGQDVSRIIRESRCSDTGELIKDKIRIPLMPSRHRNIIQTHLGKEVLLEEEAFPFLCDLRRAVLGVVKNITVPVTIIAKEVASADSNKVCGHGYRSATAPVREGIFEFFEWIYDQAGLNLYDYKLGSVLRRVERCLISCGCGTYGDYLECLKQDSSELERFLEKFTVSYTKFFRDQEVFDCIRTKILPPLVSRMLCRAVEGEADEKRWGGLGNSVGPRELRIWSVGCSSGEEAYSIASLALLECSGKSLHPTLFATDIDTKRLTEARAGVYPACKCIPIPEDVRTKCFAQRDAEHFAAKEELRNIIIFGRHDILNDPVYRHMDLILCRNVLIYLTPERQEELLRSFVWALRPGGYLVLGSSETLFGDAARYCVGIGNNLRIYRKIIKE